RAVFPRRQALDVVLLTAGRILAPEAVVERAGVARVYPLDLERSDVIPAGNEHHFHLTEAAPDLHGCRGGGLFSAFDKDTGGFLDEPGRIGSLSGGGRGGGYGLLGYTAPRE